MYSPVVKKHPKLNSRENMPCILCGVNVAMKENMVEHMKVEHRVTQEKIDFVLVCCMIEKNQQDYLTVVFKDSIEKLTRPKSGIMKLTAKETFLKSEILMNTDTKPILTIKRMYFNTKESCSMTMNLILKLPNWKSQHPYQSIQIYRVRLKGFVVQIVESVTMNWLTFIKIVHILESILHKLVVG